MNRGAKPRLAVSNTFSVNKLFTRIVWGLFFGVLFIGGNPLWGSPRKKAGHVEGLVLDERGNPVAHARVIATPADRGFTYAPYTDTDANGTFSISGLEWGEYEISAEKKSDNYANTLDVFYAGDSEPAKLELSPDRPTAHVEIRFPAKAGVLIVSLFDSRNGEELDGCVHLERTSEKGKWRDVFLSKPNRRVLIPPHTDVQLRVHSAGYFPWVLHDSKGPASIRLNSSEQKHLRIPLDPDPAFPTREDKFKEARRLLEVGCK